MTFGNWLHRELSIYDNCHLVSLKYLTAFINHLVDADSITAEEINLINLELRLIVFRYLDTFLFYLRVFQRLHSLDVT